MVSGPTGFPSTRHSALLGALSDDRELRRGSWERLARAYHRPVETYLRRRWRRADEDARDLAQAFFERCLDHPVVDAYDPARGRFRTYLRLCLDRFVLDHDRATRAKKRGGGARATELDETHAAVEAEAEAIFESAWVKQVLALALDALRAHCEANGKGEHLRIFERYHIDPDPPSYEALAAELGTRVSTITNRLGYARRHFRRLVLDVLRDLTADDEELRLEAQAVLGIDL